LEGRELTLLEEGKEERVEKGFEASWLRGKRRRGKGVMGLSTGTFRYGKKRDLTFCDKSFDSEKGWETDFRENY